MRSGLSEVGPDPRRCELALGTGVEIGPSLRRERVAVANPFRPLVGLGSLIPTPFFLLDPSSFFSFSLAMLIPAITQLIETLPHSRELSRTAISPLRRMLLSSTTRCVKEG